MGPFLLAQALQMLLACVFHSVPLNINDSPKEKGGGTLIIFWSKSAARKNMKVRLD